MEESTGCAGKWWGRSTSSFWGQGFTLVWCGGRHLCQWWTLCESHGFSGLSPLPGFYTLACAQCVWEPRVGRDVYETPLLPRLLREALGIHCKGWYQAATLYHQRWNGCYELFQISRFSMIFSQFCLYVNLQAVAEFELCGVLRLLFGEQNLRGFVSPRMWSSTTCGRSLSATNFKVFTQLRLNGRNGSKFDNQTASAMKPSELCKAVSQIIIERYEAPILELKVFLWDLSGTFHLSIPKLSTVTVQAIVAGSSLEAGFFFGFNQWIIERVRSCVDPDHSNGYALLYAAANFSCFASLQMKYDSVNQCWNPMPCIKPNTCANFNIFLSIRDDTR